jgi:hypothetical protein
MKMPITEVELDSRQRAPLARVLPNGANTRYRVERLEDGTIVMTPVVSLSEREIALLANPGRVESIREGVRQAKAGEVFRYEPDHFAKELAAEGIDAYESDEED